MGDASMRIGVLHFSHETVTFLKNDTTLEDFIYPGSPAKGEPGSPAKGEALLKFDPKSYMGGFVKMALDKLPYEDVALKDYYPYGNPVFPQ